MPAPKHFQGTVLEKFHSQEETRK